MSNDTNKSNWEDKLSPIQKLELELERTYASNQLMPRVRRYYDEYEMFDFKAYFNQIEVTHKFGINLLAEIGIKKRCPLNVMFGILRNVADIPDDSGNTIPLEIQMDRAIEGGLVDYDDKTDTLIVITEISAEVRDELDLFQYPLPMVVEPRRINNNLDSGYYTFRKSILLNNNEPEGLDLRLDHINRVNKIPLSINLKTAKATTLKWKNLSKRKDGESKEEYDNKLYNFNKYKETTMWVMENLTQATDKIYLTCSVDFRGRTYYNGYHCNPQNTEWNRACIELYNKEIIPLD